MIKLDLRSERTIYYRAARDRISPLSYCDFKLNHDLSVALQSDFVYDAVYSVIDKDITDERLETDCNNKDYDIYKTVEYRLLLDGPDFEYVEDTMKRLINKRSEDNELFVALSQILGKKVMSVHTAFNRSLNRYDFSSIRYMTRKHVIWVSLAEPLTYISKANATPILKDTYKLKLYRNLMETQLLSALDAIGLDELPVNGSAITLHNEKLEVSVRVRNKFRNELQRVLETHMDAILNEMFNGELIDIFNAFSLDKQDFIKRFLSEVTCLHTTNIQIDDKSFN